MSAPLPALVSPYLTAAEAAAYLRFGSVKSFLNRYKALRVPACRRGQVLLFHREDLDTWAAGASSRADLRLVRGRA